MPLERISTLTVKDLRSHSAHGRELLIKLLNRLNSFVDGINQEIDAFNAPENIAHQAEYLVSIKAKMKVMDEAQKNEDLERCPQYFEKIQTKLFREIQEEQHRLDTAAGILPTTSSLTLSELIAEMDPDKVNELTSILLNKGEHELTTALQNLYQPGDAGKAVFDVFLSAHEITVLGGMNSKNFKVVNKDTDEAQVLKVENRMNRDKRAEVQLRGGAIAGFFTSLFAERRTYCVDRVTGGMISRSLQVTEFCPGNDIAAHGQGLKDDDELRVISAASVYVRMADILEEMQRDGCFFPDMKNSNWLIDSAGQVRNADGKSFEFTNPSGQVEPDVRVLSTPYVTAPEMMKYPKETYSADKAQVYMLTKNLYQYLSSCSHNRFYRQNYFGGSELILDAADLSFAHPIFSTDKGLQFKQLIEDGMKLNPADRPSLAEIQARIKVIDPEYAQADAKQIEIIRGRCEVHLTALEGLVIGPNDIKMADDLRLKSNLMTEMQQTPNVQDFIAFEKSLKKAQDEVKEITSRVQQEIERLSHHSMDLEAGLLRAFMCDLSLEERTRVMQLDKPETERLLQLLESIEKAEKAQRSDASDVSQLLKFLNQEIEVHIEPERLRKEGERFSNALLKLDLVRVASEDSQMEAFILKIYADLGLNPNSREVKTASQKIEDVFSKIEGYAQKINTEIEVLEDEGMILLSDALGKAMSNVPVTERGDIPEGKTAEARQVLEVLALIDEKKQEKELDARRDAEALAAKELETLRDMEALKTAKIDFKDSLSKLEALKVPLGDPDMKAAIDGALLELESDRTVKEIIDATRIVLNLLNDIKAVSEATNLKIKTLLAMDDEEMQGLGTLLAEKMAAVSFDQRNDALYEGKIPEARAVLEVLTLIDEKGQEKAIQKTQDFKQAVSDGRTNSEAESGKDDVPRLE
ncbi:MAG: hypothetical protein K0U37_05330 [Gammaproteobacteria bacterium]|nr:hypothetical protein [Gammaproteobacteria bacterium]